MEISLTKPVKCPRCKSTRIVATTSVRPEFDDQVGSDVQSSQVVLGGCDALPDAPAWICADCQQEFFKPDDQR